MRRCDGHGSGKQGQIGMGEPAKHERRTFLAKRLDIAGHPIGSYDFCLTESGLTRGPALHAEPFVNAAFLLLGLARGEIGFQRCPLNENRAASIDRL